MSNDSSREHFPSEKYWDYLIETGVSVAELERLNGKSRTGTDMRKALGVTNLSDKYEVKFRLGYIPLRASHPSYHVAPPPPSPIKPGGARCAGIDEH
jgi:hypothetical protein